MRRAVDDRSQHRRNTEVTVVYRHRPDVDGDVQQQVRELLHRKAEDVDVVGHRLQEAVNRMEGMARIRRRHLPAMVWLVDGGVQKAVMEATVDPINQTIGEKNEADRREDHTKPTCGKEGRIQNIVEYISCS